MVWHVAEAQPGALALGFGGEKRLFEQAGFNFLGHARPGVSDTKHDVVAGDGARMRARVVLIKRGNCWSSR